MELTGIWIFKHPICHDIVDKLVFTLSLPSQEATQDLIQHPISVQVERGVERIRDRLLVYLSPNLGNN